MTDDTSQGTASPSVAEPTSSDATDGELLRLFAETGSQAAFKALVDRHGPAVHAAARRQVDASLADDVPQAVFLLLMRKRNAISKPEHLAGWLINATHYCVRTAQRGAFRRTRHERSAALHREQQQATATGATVPAELFEQVDAALARLGSLDRTIITLAYLERQRPEQVAATLQMSLAAVRKRTTRAILKLRDTLADKNVAVSTETLIVGLTVTSAPPAPGIFQRLAESEASHGPAAQIATATARRMSLVPASVVVAAAPRPRSAALRNLAKRPASASRAVPKNHAASANPHRRPPRRRSRSRSRSRRLRQKPSANAAR